MNEMAWKRVLHVLFTNPAFYPPILRGVRLLAETDWDVRVVGAHVKDTPETSLPEWLSRRVTMLGGTRLPTVVRYTCFALLVLFLLFRYRPHSVYLSDPKSTLVGVVGVVWPTIRVIYHEHDTPASVSRSVSGKFIDACRRFVASRADVCIVPSKGRLDLLPPTFLEEQKQTVVKNVPLRSEVRKHAPRGEPEFWVQYVGSIVPSRLPSSIVDALTTLPDVRLRIIGYETAGHAGYVKELTQRARERGIEERIYFEGFISSFNDLPDVIREADLGFCVMPSDPSNLNERTMAGASNKPFQFLACGVPLLVTDRPEWREMFVDRGVARTCRPESPGSIADALRWFIEHREEGRAMGRRGRRLIQKDWNYETEFAPVIELLERQPAA